MEEDIARIEHLIERCKQCKLNACITCDICWSEVQAIENIANRVKKLEEIEKEHQKENGELREQIEKLEQDIEKEKIYYEHARDLIEKYQDLVRMILNDRDKNFVPKAEIEKKDKIIDLMAERLTTPINSKEWVIDYYKRKVE